MKSSPRKNASVMAGKNLNYILEINFVREIKRPAGTAGQKGTVDVNNPNTATPHFEIHSQVESILVPEREIKKVLQFLGFQMFAGQLEVEAFDQIINGLIGTCEDDFQFELIELKRKIKSILAQCRG